MNVTELGLETEAGPETPWMLTEADWRIIDGGLAKARVHQGGKDIAGLLAAAATLDRSRVDLPGVDASTTPTRSDAERRNLVHVNAADMVKIRERLTKGRFERKYDDILVVGSAIEKITGASPLDENDWKGIRLYFEHLKTTSPHFSPNSKRFAAAAAAMTELGHPPIVPAEHWASMENFLANFFRTKRIVDATELAADIAVLDPARVQISDQNWELMIDRMIKAKEQKAPKTMLALSVALTKLARIKHPTIELATNTPPLPETKSY